MLAIIRKNLLLLWLFTWNQFVRHTRTIEWITLKFNILKAVRQPTNQPTTQQMNFNAISKWQIYIPASPFILRPVINNRCKGAYNWTFCLLFNEIVQKCLSLPCLWMHCTWFVAVINKLSEFIVAHIDHSGNPRLFLVVT